MVTVRDFMARAALKPALGNLKSQPKAGGGNVAAGTSAITFVSAGSTQNLDIDAEEMSRLAYLGNVYVMRCVRTVAETIAGLPWCPARIRPTRASTTRRARWPGCSGPPPHRRQADPTR